ncbi:MAG: glutamine-hydrolyzing carbamoyl-phosphate synthase small subunit [Atribacterota bacterium]|nr:glutamine-hydrolyzing carbamoyl-phosphate synthase small subunit [Atribacterota bacterium]
MSEKTDNVKLVLEDNSVFEGKIFGARKEAAGEVVFNTGMVGYPESLTDPSYCGQILVMTFPLIGNYGVPSKQRENKLLKNFESEKIQIQGLVVTDYSKDYCHWNAEKSLSTWLFENEIPGISGIDTRKLTKKLRSKGTILGKIVYDDKVENIEFKKSAEIDLMEQVSIKEPIVYEKGKKRIAIIDCGAKNSIIQAFLKRDITVIRVPWNYDFLQEKIDGVLVSNGPGDPKKYTETIKNIERTFARNIPILGVCLGCQILGLAAGADTYKLKYGHRSQNQPCMEVGTNRCYITSQNHGYAIDADSLKQDWREWFYNLNDQTNEGIVHMSRPFFGAQFHPEASPGPDDSEYIFDMFLRVI